jgi:hypothetical protein
MVCGWLRVFVRVSLLLLLAPAAGAFEVVDTLPYPSRGGFPEAYERDPVYPLNLYAQAGLMYDSNPFRLADGTDSQAVLGNDDKADGVMRYGVGGSYAARVVGRQAVRLAARGEYYDYFRYNTLDHFAYGLRGEWLYALGNDLSGTIGYAREEGLADPAEVQRPLKDEITVNRFYANADYRLGPNTVLRGGVTEERARREGDRAPLRTESSTVFGGAAYVTPLGNSIGLEARKSEGSAPPGELIDPTGALADNRFDEHEVAVVVVYNLGVTLTAAGRVGRTKRDYTEVAVQPFDDNTARGSIGWRPFPKFRLTFDFYREPRAVLETDATHVDVRGTATTLAWAPTLKLVFTAGFVNDRLRSQTSLDPTAPGRDETVRIWRLGAGWEPRRQITLGSGFEFGERTSNTLGRDYDYYALMANLRWDW